jgi:hypothetical protein
MWVDAWGHPGDQAPGCLLVPKRAQGPNGVIAGGVVEVGPDDPEYER